LSRVQLKVIPIRNERLGETITVAGLLMGTDVITQLQACELGEIVVLPRIMFDHPSGVALDDVSVADVATALGRPVALATTMGDVLDALRD
jgi:NifB/MoaA-like Fe-S oxidoreductase